MPIGPGSRIGPYEVTALIGEGGMGKVWRAHHTALKRDDALKVLPDAFASDPERLARFRREAQVLASFNHPNIAHVYGLEQSDGVQALVMELVEGPTVADRIAQGRIPVDEALAIAKQIAEALEAAHERGIIHRDLKPANVKVRSDGTVKVLDFGLAKALEPTSAAGLDATASPTITSPAMMTGVGMLLGTAAYMSPEQARGKLVDKRSDIWAFGCVLYEMLTGQRAFEDEDVSMTLSKVLQREPDFTVLPTQTPEPIRRLLRRCLQKNAYDRLRDVADARLDIEEARSAPVAAGERTAAPAASHQRAGVWAWAFAGVAVTAVAAGAYVRFQQPSGPSELPPAHVQVVLPLGVHVAIETDHPAIALAPDGSQLVFVGDDNGRRQLYVRDLAIKEARILPGTEGASSPFYSPDGGWIGFFDAGLLKKVSPSGGVAVPVHVSTQTTVNRGATWTVNDTAILATSPNSGLSQGVLTGERVSGIDEWTRITDNTLPYAWPNALPDGDHMLFTDNGTPENARVALLSLSTREVRILLNGGTNPRYSSTDHVLFARGGALYAIPFDARRMEATGSERRLLQGVVIAPNGAAQYAVAANGTLAYISGYVGPTEHELRWVDRTGRIGALLADGRTYEDPRLSPDGRRLAFTSFEGANSDVWVRDLARGANTRVTTHPGEDFEAVWGPDGRQLAFASEIEENAENSGPSLAWVTEVGQRPEQLLQSPGLGNWEFPTSWSPDGRWLLFARTKVGTSRDLALLPTAGARSPTVYLETTADEGGATFSPDGRWIAYISNETGRYEVYVRPFPSPGTPVTISAGGGVEPRWSRDGRELFYRNGNRMMAVTISGGAASAPTTLFEGRFEMKGYGGSSANYDVAPDGRFVMIGRKNQLIPTAIEVIFNWPRALGAE